MRLRLILGALIVLFALPVGQAPACGCGAFFPPEDGPRVSVSNERAVLIHQNGRETLHVSLAFDRAGSGSEVGPSNLAWLMPVPSAPAVRKGDDELFYELERAALPKIVYRTRWHLAMSPPMTAGTAGDRAADGAPGAAAPADVDVLSSQSIGPLDTVTLRARKASELTRWLRENNYRTTKGFTEEAQHYLDDGWVFVAAKIRSQDDVDPLVGVPPLRLDFASDSPVYPLRLSRLARGPYRLRLSVLTANRVDISGLGRVREERIVPDRGNLDYTPVPSATEPGQLLYAGAVSSRRLPGDGDGLVLSQFDLPVVPDDLKGDPTISAASSSKRFQRIQYQDRDVYLLDGLRGLLGPLTQAVLSGITQ